MKKIILAAIFAGFLVFGGVSFMNSNNLKIIDTTYAQGEADFEGIIPSTDNKDPKIKDLAVKIQQGRVEIGDVFYMFIKLIDLVTKLAGTIAVLFLIYGGYQYMLGSVTDDKEGAKKTIKYAIMGIVVTFMAYLIVNIVKVQFLGF